MKLLLTPGELKQRAQHQNLLTNAVFAAENDDFVDVQIITLQQYLSELAYTEAWQHSDVIDGNMSALQQRADDLMRTKYAHAKEFVQVDDNRIVVGVATDIVDDSTVDYVVDLLSEVQEFKAGVRTEIGDLIQVYG